jgi:cytochrome b561
MIVAPRIGYRLLSRPAYNVRELQGNSSVENMLGKAGHYLLYGFIAVMPATGIAMGYFGGAGLPFFFTKFAGIKKTEENKASTGNIAKNAFKIHKQVGVSKTRKQTVLEEVWIWLSRHHGRLLYFLLLPSVYLIFQTNRLMANT